MKDNLTQEQINKLIEYINGIAEFSKEQLPDVAAQLLTYGAISSWLFIILFTIIGIISGIIAFINRDDMPFFSSISLILSTVLVIAGINNLLKINYAPKVFLLKELAGLIN